MAAPSGSVSDSESSEDDDTEELRRCQEAAVPAWGWGLRSDGGQEVTAKDNLPAARPSLRHKVDDHEQDGNELQTTPEFRVHVAKKLGALLDSCITISDSSPRPAQAPAQAATEEDDGFRLFFTSIPGSPKDTAPPTRNRKRPPSTSSSDSDSDEQWRRCREAAVSASDILQPGALPVQEAPTEQLQLRKKKKKKKKKGQPQVKNGEEAGPRETPEKQPRPLSLHRNPAGVEAQHNGDHTPLTTKRKKKRKKNRREDSGDLLFPAQKDQVASAVE